MTPTLDPEPVEKGVAITSPTLISDAVKQAVENVLGRVPPGKTFAVVVVATEAGANLAFAYRPPTQDLFEVGAWVGKSGWEQPLGGGVYLKAAF